MPSFCADNAILPKRGLYACVPANLMSSVDQAGSKPPSLHASENGSLDPLRTFADTLYDIS